MLVEITKMKFR